MLLLMAELLLVLMPHDGSQGGKCLAWIVHGDGDRVCGFLEWCSCILSGVLKLEKHHERISSRCFAI